MKVENMKSPRTGRSVPNQYIITTNAGRYFQSYDSIIVFIPNPKDWAARPKNCNNVPCTQLDKTYWNYSTTTSKYRNIFLGESTAETKKKIASGEYILTDLN